MSIEAIAAMLGHKSLDMTLVYAKIANRTVAEEYFTVAEKVDALYAAPAQLPADDLGPNMARLNREHHRHARQRLLRPTRRSWTASSRTSASPARSSRPAIEFRPTLLAQRADACAKGQARRAEIFDNSSPASTTPKPLDNDHPHNAADTFTANHQGSPTVVGLRLSGHVERTTACEPNAQGAVVPDLCIDHCFAVERGRRLSATRHLRQRGAVAHQCAVTESR